MSDEETTPRASRRGRPAAASASKAPVDNKTPTSRSRSAKKVVEKSTSKGGKEDREPEAAPAATPADSDDEVEIVKTVKPKPNFKSKAPIKKEVDEDDAVDSSAQEQPTSSRSSSRKEKKKEAETIAKPTRSGRVAGGADRADSAMEEDEGEEEQRGSRTASRSTRKGRKGVEEEGEAMEKAKEKKVAPSRSAKKGRKGTEEVEEEEEEQTDKRSTSRSTRKGKKVVESEDDEQEEVVDKRKKAHPTRKGKKAAAEEEDEEEEMEEPEPAKKTPSRSKARVCSDDEAEEDDEQPEEEPVKEKKPAARSTRKGKKAAEKDDEEEEEVQPKKNTRTASRSTTRRGKKAEENEEEEDDEESETRSTARPARKRRDEHVWSEDEEEEEQPKKGKQTATRRGKKAVVNEEEEEVEEQPEKTKKTTTRSTRKGKRAVESEEEEEEEEETESPKKKARVTVAEKDGGDEQGTSQSRARRRINLDDEGEKEKKKDEKTVKKVVAKKGKTLRPIETPKKKTQEERKAERAARRAERGDDDIEVLEEDTKPLIRFKPEFVNDLDLDDGARRSSSDNGESGDDDITIAGTVGVAAASDVKMKKKTIESCRAICVNIRNSLRSVFMSKDDRAFQNAVKNIVHAQQMAYERDDYEHTSRAYYDEIENQLINMMTKEEKELKSDTEGKKRVLNVMAKAAMTDFEVIDEDQYTYYWNQINYLLNKFATAEDAHIRSVFCSWVASLLTYSKEAHKKEYAKNTQDELEELHNQKVKASREKMTEEEKALYGNVDMDRRIIDGHMLKLGERKRLYSALYTSLKHTDVAVRCAAIKGMSVIQDDPIPAAFTEAVRHSPKDLIMRQLMDVHVNVRTVAIEELRPKSDQQIEFLLNTAMQEKHEKVRILAFSQLGRLRMVQFNVPQRHALLAMLRDNVMGKIIEQKLLHSWLYEMLTGENPRPIITDDRRFVEEASKKKTPKKNLVDNWTMAPLKLLSYLDCINHKEDVMEVLKKGSDIARKEIGLHALPVSRWISTVIEDSEKSNMGIIRQTECRHLLDRTMDDLSRATIVTYWLHCLEFVHANAKDEGDRYQAVNTLSPSLGELHSLITDLLEDERERRAPRKKMVERGEIDVTHPACQPTAASLQSVVALLLSGFRYLEHGDTDAMKEWHTLLMTLTRGDHCDLSPAIWEVVMHDLLKYHTTAEPDRDDLIYEVASGMGFNFEDVVSGGGKGEKSPRRQSKSPTKKGGMARDNASTPTSSHERREADEKRLEARRIVLARPDCLGMIHGALKTAFFNSTSDSFNIVFKAELDAYRSISDNRLQAMCLECIGMFGNFSADIAEKYIGFVMENLNKPAPNEDDMQPEDGGAREEEERIRKRRKKLDRPDIDELEKEYQRRMKEESERKEAEERSRRGGRNHCVGMALVVITDFIVAHTISKVDKWLEACSEEKKYTAFGLFAQFEALVHDPDLELAFKVAHCTFKLTLHDRELMRHLNRTAAKLQFRALHPSSFAHSKYRSCVVGFFKHFGQKSTANQMALVEIVITMLKMLKDRPRDCRNIIDRGTADYAVSVVVWSCAPSSLKPPASGIRPTHTAHGSMLAKLKLFLEKCEEEARDRDPVDMEYYKAILGAVGGSQFSRQKASLIRDIYNLLYTNADLLEPWDKGGEAKKMIQKITKSMDVHLDCVNEIIRLNKAIGVTLTDDQVLLPFEDEEKEMISGLREKAREMGKDIREVSPVKDDRVSRAGGYGRTPMTKKRGGREGERGLMSTLKKEPAKSKSYAAHAAAERKEAAAAAAASSSSLNQATPSRAPQRTLRKRTKMATIEEARNDSDSN